MDCIKLYFCETGYFVTGCGLEICQSTVPVTLDSIQQTYVVLSKALQELINLKSFTKVYAYNHTRVIDEMNGAEPIDIRSTQIRKHLRQYVLPKVNGIVMFKKKPLNEIMDQIQAAKRSLIDSVNIEQRNKRINEIVAEVKTATKQNICTRVQRLRNRWFKCQ